MSQKSEFDDPLSMVLDLLDARSVLSTALEAAGDWALRVGGHEGMKFNAMVRGAAWLQVDGEADVFLNEGDCFMLSRGRPFVLTTDRSLTPRDASAVFDGAIGNVARMGVAVDDKPSVVIGGKMTLEPALAPLLTDALPALIHLRHDDSSAAIVNWLLSRLLTERLNAAPGSAQQCRLLMQMMFVELIRAYLGGVPAGNIIRTTGWLAALNHPGLRRALNAMHAEPSRPWTLPALANVSHMSRSTFALTFKTMVGLSPLDYLIRWRIHLASHAIRGGCGTIAQIAMEAGYSSESAFGNAFKRILGTSPRRYRSST